MVLRRRSATIVVAGLAASLAMALVGPAALAGGQVEHFDLRGAANRPYSIVNGPDGNLWFTQSDGNAIGRITPDGTLKRFLLPTEGSKPYGITVGPDGNLWFTERLSNRIGVMDASGTILAEYDLPTQDAQPWDITLGPDGNMCFTELAGRNIGRIKPKGRIKEFPVPGVGLVDRLRDKLTNRST